MPTNCGYTVAEIKAWRCSEKEAGRPCGLDDFFNAHDIPHCGSKQPVDTSDDSTVHHKGEKP